jgi:hypothetical protein
MATPGLMVLLMVTDFTYEPLALAGFNLMMV